MTRCWQAEACSHFVWPSERQLDGHLVRAADRVLQEQTYPGAEDHRAHFENLLPAFRDGRYIRVDDKPLFVVYQPGDLSAEDVALWQSLARAAGLPGLHLTGIVNNLAEARAAREVGVDACLSRALPVRRAVDGDRGSSGAWLVQIAAKRYRQLFRKPYHVYDSREAAAYLDLNPPAGMDFYPCVFPGWDNTPRSGLNGLVFTHSSPGLFQEHLRQAAARVANYPAEHQIIILKSWNEWAEGNYLEPERFGTGFDALKAFLKSARREMEFRSASSSRFITPDPLSAAVNPRLLSPKPPKSCRGRQFPDESLGPARNSRENIAGAPVPTPGGLPTRGLRAIWASSTARILSRSWTRTIFTCPGASRSSGRFCRTPDCTRYEAVGTF